MFLLERNSKTLLFHGRSKNELKEGDELRITYNWRKNKDGKVTFKKWNSDAKSGWRAASTCQEACATVKVKSATLEDKIPITGELLTSLFPGVTLEQRLVNIGTLVKMSGAKAGDKWLRVDIDSTP